MTVHGENELKALGLGVAKCTVRSDDPSLLDVVYYMDAQRPAGDFAAKRLTLRSAGGAIAFLGEFRFSAIDGDCAPFELEAVTEGAGFDLTVRRGEAILARAMALTDPDDSRALLISAWSGETKPYGIVKYTIRDARTITGYYISLMSPDVPGGDKATGDTTTGFPGQYELNSLEESGRAWGPHDWAITARGDVFDLTWTEHGKIFCRGFGIADPGDSNSIIVNYIAV